MTWNQREPGPKLSFVNVQIGAAQTASVNLHEDLHPK